MTRAQRLRAIRQLARQRNAVEREIRARCDLSLAALRWLFPAPHNLAHDSTWCVRALRRRLFQDRRLTAAECRMQVSDARVPEEGEIP